ncbi:hypothetical protein ACLBWT_21555 [Paenibacillus sp. D51F]
MLEPDSGETFSAFWNDPDSCIRKFSIHRKRLVAFSIKCLNQPSLQGPSPACITDQRLNMVAWNRAASLIYGNYEKMSARERNTVWRTFTSPYVRQLLQDNWEAHARHRLAHFRASCGKFAGDPWWMELAGTSSAAAEISWIFLFINSLDDRKKK